MKNQIQANISLDNPRHPYSPSNSGLMQIKPTSIAEMKREIGVHAKEETVPARHQRVLLIIGPDVPQDVVELYCEYEKSFDIIERIDYTDPRVGSFSEEGFVSGKDHGMINGKPVFLLRPDCVTTDDDVITLNYFQAESCGSVRIYTAPIQHPICIPEEDDIMDDIYP